MVTSVGDYHDVCRLTNSQCHFKMGLRDCFSLINRRWIVTAASSMVFGGILSPMSVYGLLFVDIEAEIGMNAVQTGTVL